MTESLSYFSRTAFFNSSSVPLKHPAVTFQVVHSTEFVDFCQESIKLYANPASIPITLMVFVHLRSAPLKFAPIKSAPLKSAPLNFVPLKFA